MSDMTYITVLQLIAIPVMFMAQAFYMKHCFERFRRRVYMDVMNSLINQKSGGKFTAVYAEKQDARRSQRNLRIVRDEDKH